MDQYGAVLRLRVTSSAPRPVQALLPDHPSFQFSPCTALGSLPVYPSPSQVVLYRFGPCLLHPQPISAHWPRSQWQGGKGAGLPSPRQQEALIAMATREGASAFLFPPSAARSQSVLAARGAVANGSAAGAGLALTWGRAGVVAMATGPAGLGAVRRGKKYKNKINETIFVWSGSNRERPGLSPRLSPACPGPCRWHLGHSGNTFEGGLGQFGGSWGHLEGIGEGWGHQGSSLGTLWAAVALGTSGVGGGTK